MSRLPKVKLAKAKISKGGLPNFSFIGKSNSGKTTLLERVVGELSGRGYRIATAKHHLHPIELDIPGKDSWRHAQAGAVLTMIASPTKFSVLHHIEGEPSYDDLIANAKLANCDILITEGYKHVATERIELVREARKNEPVSSPKDLVALVTDRDDLREVYEKSVPVFGLDDINKLSDFIVARYGLELKDGKEVCDE